MVGVKTYGRREIFASTLAYGSTGSRWKLEATPKVKHSERGLLAVTAAGNGQWVAVGLKAAGGALIEVS